MIDRDDILLTTYDLQANVNNRERCGVQQIKIAGVWASLKTYQYEITAQSGATFDLNTKVTNEGLILKYPCHKDLNVTIYRNGLIQPITKWSIDDAGLVTFVDILEDENLIFIFN